MAKTIRVIRAIRGLPIRGIQVSWALDGADDGPRMTRMAQMIFLKWGAFPGGKTIRVIRPIRGLPIRGIQVSHLARRLRKFHFAH